MQESFKLLMAVVSPADPAVRSKRYRELCDVGVSADDFTGNDKSIYTFIEDYARSRSAVPSKEILSLEIGVQLPGSIDDDDASFRYWLDAYKVARTRSILYEYGGLFQELALSGDVSNVKSIYREFGQKLLQASGSAGVKRLLPLMEEVVSRHDLIRSGKAETGVPLGFPSIDAIMGGAQRGDLIILAGQQGTGKSYVMCRSAQFSADADRRVMFVTMEMTSFQIARRIAALGSSVNSMSLRLGRLPPWGMEPVLKYIDSWRSYDRDRFLLIDGNVGMSVSDIQMRVQEYQPGVLYLDGLYMLKPSRYTSSMKRWEVVMEAVEELKRLALSENIPVVASTQFSKKGAKDGMEGIGYSYAIAQAASVGLAIENIDENSYCNTSLDMIEYKILRLIKGREGENGAIRIKYDMNRSTIEEDAVIDGLVLPYDGVLKEKEFDVDSIL